ncbi:DUF4190 domain-containing protein [Microbacterium sp. XT11]|uniref:DUF4190 domain-containing protein n=1 Tax=Microbacterium sp. XT11 TaxID=367477 RepID=UPI0018DEB9C3|nr:DUF4190 domain-containing protein [Microbacterium sp. XT11]
MSDNNTPGPAGDQPDASFPAGLTPPPAASAAPSVPPVPAAPAPPFASYPGAAPSSPAPSVHAPAAPPAAYARPATPPAYPAPAGYSAAPGYPATSAYPAAAYAPVRPNSGLAIASLICGIGGIVLFWLWVPVIASIVAVVTGHMAMKQTKNNPAIGGRGMAIAGLITGYFGIGLLLALILIVVVTFLFIGAVSVPFLFTS